jgi:hypothetical protein
MRFTMDTMNDAPASGLAANDAAPGPVLADTLGAIAHANGEVLEARDALLQAREEIKTLKEALRTRTIIGQATGMLMRELNLSADDAFAHMVKLSSHSNVKIRDIATRMVDDANARANARATAQDQTRTVVRCDLTATG